MVKMDKSRLSNIEKLNLCRRYYLIGFFGLPMVWAINYIWFSVEANATQEFEEQKEIKKLRRRSGIGTILWLILITIWVVLFQTNRVRWGDFGDDISFIIPTGY